MGIFSWLGGNRVEPISIGTPTAAASTQREKTPTDPTTRPSELTPPRAETSEDIDAYEKLTQRIEQLALSLGMQSEASQFRTAKSSNDSTATCMILERIHAQCERRYGSDHSSCADVLEQLGFSSPQQPTDASWQETESFWRRCLTIRESVLGDDHIDTLRVRHWLGGLCVARSRHAEAIELLERNLRIIEGQHLSGFKWFDQMLSLLAISYRNVNKLESAEACWRRLVATLSEKCGPSHPETLRISNQLIGFLIFSNRTEEALNLLNRNKEPVEAFVRRRANEIVKAGFRIEKGSVEERVAKAAAVDDSPMARVAYTMSSSYAKCGDVETAERFYQFAVNLWLCNSVIPSPRPFARPRKSTDADRPSP